MEYQDDENNEEKFMEANDFENPLEKSYNPTSRKMQRSIEKIVTKILNRELKRNVCISMKSKQDIIDKATQVRSRFLDFF